jgi:sugar/nucleoside kinase (ribokinase family)
MMNSDHYKNLSNLNKKIAVAGHVCLDIIPPFDGPQKKIDKLILPGKLNEVGPAIISTGGAVSNTGLALHRLGIPTVLMGKIGSDFFGKIILDLLNSQDPALTKGMVMSAKSHTSYTVIISPPGSDRLFLHFPGANDDFGATDLQDIHLGGFQIFHFGYPPLMRRMYQNEGRELEALFRWVQNQGITTSLDLAKPDPESEAGRVDWRLILERVLPLVDIFLPSVDEILFMLHQDIFHSLTQKHGEVNFIKFLDTELLDYLADTLIKLGSNVVAIKLGDQGLYLRTGNNIQRLAGATDSTNEITQWSERQLIAPCFHTNVIGTTGTGDCTVAGLLAGLTLGVNPVDALRLAVGVGACCTENLDATSGVPSLNLVYDRIDAGWKCRDLHINKPGWKWLQDQFIWQGPRDKAINNL